MAESGLLVTKNSDNLGTRSLSGSHGKITIRGRSLRILLTHAIALTLASILVACSTSVADLPGNPDPKPGQAIAIESLENVDIGPVLFEGSFVAASDNSAVIAGSGRDIWDESDEFHFAYTEVEGDFSVTVKVVDVEYTDEWAKAGLMVRQNLSPTSKHALMAVTPAGRAGLTWRADHGNYTASEILDGYGAPTWLKLVRQGQTVTGYVSADGETWLKVEEISLSLPDTAFVGLALTSHAPERVANANVEGFVLDLDAVEPPKGSPEPEPEPEPSPEPILGQWVCPVEPLAPAYRPTIFVSTTGSDSNSGRSESQPLRTLAAAASIVNPGDVVWVRGGTYSSDVSFYRSGTASAPIVIESYPGECAILDGSGLVDRFRKVRLEGVSHYVFRNFVVRNSPENGVTLFESNHNVVSNIESYGNYSVGVAVQRSSYNLVSHVIAHDNFDYNNGGGDADGIGISAGDGNRIQYCIAYNNSDDGVDSWVSTNTTIDRCISFNNGYQAQGNGNGFKLGGQGQTVGTVITNSIAFGNRRNGFDHNTSPGVTVENGTSFGNGGWGFVINNGVLRNNLAYNNAGGEAYRGNNTEVTNSWNLGLTSPGFVSTNQEHDGFLSLTAGSGAVGAGTGSQRDLGALPYGQTIASVIGFGLRELK